MIVKNESKCILETLENLHKHVKDFSYLLVNDTGSTDGTQDIVKKFIKDKGLKGEVIEHEMRTCKCHKGKYKLYPKYFHFGWNRTYALRQCYGKSKYIMMMDADDLVEGDLKIEEHKDLFEVRLRNEGRRWYSRNMIVKNHPKFDWIYEEGVHETLESKGMKHSFIKEKTLTGCNILSRRLGARNMDPKKYLNDAMFLEEIMQHEGETPRRLFYAAKSYYDYQAYQDASKWFEKRIKVKGYMQEVYYSCLCLIDCYIHLKKDKELIFALQKKAEKICPERAEVMHAIMIMHYGDKEYDKVVEVGKNFKPRTAPQGLFINSQVYTYGIPFITYISYYHMQKYKEAMMILLEIMNSKLCPDEKKDELHHNICHIAGFLKV